MANITRIKAKDPAPKKPKALPKKEPKKPSSKKVAAPATPLKTPQKPKPKKTSPKAKGQKSKQAKKPMPTWLAVITWPFRTIAKPFIALGHYIKASWHEIRQVRWPNRKTTWKMTGAILIYAALILAIVLLLDALFTFIFNNILGS